MTTYTSSLRFEKQVAGANSGTWGDPHLNAKVIDLADEAVAGYSAINCAGSSDVTLTASNGTSDQSRKAILKFTGVLTGNINVIIPSVSKTYAIWNATTGSFTLGVKTSGGTGADIPQSQKTYIFCDGTDTYNLFNAVKTAGKETIYIPAVAMSPATTNGAAQVQAELTAGQPELRCLDFDPTNKEYSLFEIAFPKSWDEGTLTYQVHWTANSTSTNSVVWNLQAVAVSDNDAIQTSYGTPVAITDANGSSVYTERVSAESSAMTIAGSPAANDMIYFRFYRDPTDDSDTLAVDARMIGIKLFFTTDSGNDGP